MVDEIAKAWAAGFFDGDGSISISKNSLPSSPQYALHAVVTSSDLSILEGLSKNFKGHIHIARSPTALGNKISYQWALHGVNASQFLGEVLPYLKLKRLQAEIGIQFQRTIEGKPVSKDIWREREELYQRIKKLNLLGKGAGERRTRKSRKG